MARRVLRPVDSGRTEQLAMDELFVVKGKGDTDHYVAWLYNYDEFPKECPACGGNRMMVHDRFPRTYMDYIIEEGVPRIIHLDYQFYKYRCLNHECGRIFPAEITFATVNDNVTHRLEDKIAELVIAGQSYEDICLFFRNQISRQGIGQIFNRWVNKRNESRKTKELPEIIGAITGSTDKAEYTMIFCCHEENNTQVIRILDILLGIDSDCIIASLRRFGSSSTRFILTDCNPTVYAAAKEALPKSIHIIPAELWFKLVRNDYVDYIHPSLRWLPYKRKLELMIDPRAKDEENTDPQLKRMFEARPGLETTYNDYQNLMEKIMNREIRWTIDELDETLEDLYDPVLREHMGATMVQYKEYRREIAEQQEHWRIVPETLLFQTDTLEKLISKRRTFSEEALQAAVLYSIESDLENWQGIKIEEIIRKLTELQENSRRSNYEYE